MKKKEHILLGGIVIAVLLSIGFIYWRSIVVKDFYIVPEEAVSEETL